MTTGMLGEGAALVALLCTGVAAGVLFAVAVSVVPALAALPPDRYVETHQLLGRNWDPIMPIIVLTATAGHLTLAVVAGGPGDRVLSGVAAALMLGTAAVSHLLNVPLNREVKRLDPARGVGPDWFDPRPRWRRFHLVRTAFAVLAFACAAFAVVT